jgi:hypothetical protein
MKLEQQVCSLDLAKRLKELGVKQESVFHWISEPRKGRKRTHVNPYRKSLGYHWVVSYDIEKGVGVDFDTAFSAFAVAELGFLLKKAGPEATIKAYGDLHGFKGTGSIGSIGMLWLLTEPDRLAKMLIYLVEYKLIGVRL